MNTEKLEALCLRVGDRLFAVEISCIREIVRAYAVTPVPGAPPELAGVVNLRGDLVPALDLHRALLDRDCGAAEDEARVVVVRCAGTTAALLVDQVLEVIPIPLEELRPVPGAGGGKSAVVAGFRREMEPGAPEVVLVLRVARLLQEAGLSMSGGES